MSINTQPNEEEKKDDIHQLRNTWAGMGLFSAIWIVTYGVVIALL